MNWENIYRRKVTDVSSALNQIQSNSRIYIGGGAGVPVQLTQGLTAKAPELKNVFALLLPTKMYFLSKMLE